jgi:AcrR family transcriptional regulator
VFAEVGYDGATTEAIAARAGASIGSLYQFFPNKRALFDALSARYLERSRAAFDAALATVAPGSSWEAVLDGTIDVFWAIASGQPAFAAVWLNGRLTRELIDAGIEMNRAFAARGEQIVALFAPDLPPGRRAVVATVVVEVVTSMLFAAARADTPTSGRLIDETKRMLRAYLREVLAGA